MTGENQRTGNRSAGQRQVVGSGNIVWYVRVSEAGNAGDGDVGQACARQAVYFIGQTDGLVSGSGLKGGLGGEAGDLIGQFGVETVQFRSKDGQTGVKVGLREAGDDSSHRLFRGFAFHCFAFNLQAGNFDGGEFFLKTVVFGFQALDGRDGVVKVGQNSAGWRFGGRFFNIARGGKV